MFDEMASLASVAPGLPWFGRLFSGGCVLVNFRDIPASACVFWGVLVKTPSTGQTALTRQASMEHFNVSDSKKPVIMIVDDSSTILRIAANFLKPTYEVVTAADGFVALAEIVNAKPDLLFLDVMMPRVNGYDACLAIKSSPEFADLPVVMLSSKDTPFDKARGALMGCSDYLTKPFAKEALLEAVRRYLPQED